MTKIVDVVMIRNSRFLVINYGDRIGLPSYTLPDGEDTRIGVGERLREEFRISQPQIRSYNFPNTTASNNIETVFVELGEDSKLAQTTDKRYIWVDGNMGPLNNSSLDFAARKVFDYLHNQGAIY